MIHLFHIISTLSFSTDYIIPYFHIQNKCSFSFLIRLSCNSSHHLQRWENSCLFHVKSFSNVFKNPLNSIRYINHFCYWQSVHFLETTN